MQRGGARYAIATDQVGTPRVVTDASGTVVKALDYDSFGVPLSDCAPASSCRSASPAASPTR